MDIEKSQEKSIGRRGLFREAFRLAGKGIAEYVDSKVEEKKEELLSLTKDKTSKLTPGFRSKRKEYLRPPGSHDESLFMQNCKGCRACISSCPRSAIAVAGPEYGEACGTPIIIPKKAPCVLCSDLLCTNACKKGVLSPISDINKVKIGQAEINERNCPAYDGASGCSLCHIRCPLSDSAIYLDDFKPKINSDLCTGCGVCEHACSTINTTPAIRVRPRILENAGAGLGPPII